MNEIFGIIFTERGDKMNDIEILEELQEKAKTRDLGINSINYYYALKHALNILKEYVSQGDKSVSKRQLETSLLQK